MRAMRPKILVMDDDERIAASVRRALIYEGYDVEVANDGEAVLARIIAGNWQLGHRPSASATSPKGEEMTMWGLFLPLLGDYRRRRGGGFPPGSGSW